MCDTAHPVTAKTSVQNLLEAGTRRITSNAFSANEMKPTVMIEILRVSQLNTNLQNERIAWFGTQTFESLVLSMTTILSLFIAMSNLWLLTRYLLPSDYGFFQFFLRFSPF